MLFLLYRIITFVLYALAFPILGTLALSGSDKWRNRLGRGFTGTVQDGQRLFWAHAASAGEARALALVVREYCKRHAETVFVVSVMTDSGYATACEALAELVKSGAVIVRFLPLDCPQSIRKALNHLQPDVFLFTETEIWPNWCAALIARRIPYALLNARLTERSLTKYSQAKSLISHVTANYRFVSCQSAEHVARFTALGVPGERISVSGNVKIDAPPMTLSAERKTKLRKRLGATESDFLLVCGSIRSGEFSGALEVYQNLKKAYPQLRLALAPRHLERCVDIVAEAQRLGVATQMFSVERTEPETVSGKVSGKVSETASETASMTVTIIDKFGILRELYGAADLAFVGGTMVPIGGHNILEPPQVGTPVLFGPHTDNVSDAAPLALEQNCAAQVSDWRDLERRVQRALTGELTFDKWTESDSDTASPVRITVDTIDEFLPKKTSSEHKSRRTG